MFCDRLLNLEEKYMNSIGIVISEICYIYEKSGPDEIEGHNKTGVSDEIFSGWAVLMDDSTLQNGWIRIHTHYGYNGWVLFSNLQTIDEADLLIRQNNEKYYYLNRAFVDILDAPKVQGNHLSHLCKNSIIELIEILDNGWSCIKTAAGVEGYTRTTYLRKRLDSDEHILGKSLLQQSGLKYLEDEVAFRHSLTENAREWLGTQYRWGGKSALGIDCSGLVFMSYLQAGLLIYRDADAKPEFPIYYIDKKELKEGDLIFFPGHVAMYLGHDEYIHSTAFHESCGVVINSFNPKHANYREDLVDQITGYASAYKNGSKLCIDSDIISRLKALPGDIGFYYKNLSDGTTFAYHEKEPHIAASVIKLFLMAALFKKYTLAELSNTYVTTPKNYFVPSCGIINYTSGVKELSLIDLITLMIIVSDNTATNILFDHIGCEELNDMIHQLGFPNTFFNRKMFDSESSAKGIENYVNAYETAILLEKLYNRTLICPEASDKMYSILCNQRLNSKLPFYLQHYSPKPVIAHKTGEDTHTTHDVAIINAKQPFILCFLGNNTDCATCDKFMAETALQLWEEHQ